MRLRLAAGQELRLSPKYLELALFLLEVERFLPNRLPTVEPLVLRQAIRPSHP